MLIQLLATSIPALLIGLFGALKLAGNPKILETMTTLGVGRHLRLLGIMELAFAELFVIPATMKLGLSSHPAISAGLSRPSCRTTRGRAIPSFRPCCLDRRLRP